MADKYIYYVAPMFNRQPLVYPRPAASASAEIPCVWQCVAHDLHHHFVRLRFSRRMPLFNRVNGSGAFGVQMWVAARVVVLHQIFWPSAKVIWQHRHPRNRVFVGPFRCANSSGAHAHRQLGARGELEWIGSGSFCIYFELPLSHVAGITNC